MTLHRLRPLASAAAIALLSAACDGNQPQGRATTAASAAEFATAAGPETALADSFAPELGVNLSTMEQLTSGLYQRELLIGEGQFAINGDRVSIQYTGWLPDGTPFASTRESGPLELVLGGPQSISAWDEGIAGMREGGRRLLVVRPGLGYPPERAPAGISAGATLVFEIQLVEIR